MQYTKYLGLTATRLPNCVQVLYHNKRACTHKAFRCAVAGLLGLTPRTEVIVLHIVGWLRKSSKKEYLTQPMIVPTASLNPKFILFSYLNPYVGLLLIKQLCATYAQVALEPQALAAGAACSSMWDQEAVSGFAMSSGPLLDLCV